MRCRTHNDFAANFDNKEDCKAIPLRAILERMTSANRAALQTAVS